MRVIETKYLYWDNQCSKYYTKSLKSGSIIPYIYALYVTSVDIAEKLYGGYGIDPCQFINTVLKNKERSNLKSRLGSSSSYTHNINNDQREGSDNNTSRRTNLTWNFFSYQSKVYDIDLSKKYTKGELPLRILKHAIIDATISDVVNSNDKNINAYNPVTKYFLDYLQITHTGRNDNRKLKSYIDKHIQLNSKYRDTKCSSIAHARLSEFTEHFMKMSEILDKLDDNLYGFITKHTQDYILKLNDMMDIDFDSLNHETKLALGPITDLSTEKISACWTHNVRFNFMEQILIEYAQDIILPCIFFSLWIIKSLCKNCHRISGHFLGPRDPEYRLFTDTSFKGNMDMFIECEEDESKALTECLWRAIIKIGIHFNLFGISVKHTLPLFYRVKDTSKNKNETNSSVSNNTIRSESVLYNDRGIDVLDFTKVTLKDFENHLSDENWFTSLGIKNHHNRQNDPKYHKPIIEYSLFDIWTILNLLSQKGSFLLDSGHLRVLLSIVLFKLYCYISCENLERTPNSVPKFEKKGYIFRLLERHTQDKSFIDALFKSKFNGNKFEDDQFMDTSDQFDNYKHNKFTFSHSLFNDNICGDISECKQRMPLFLETCKIERREKHNNINTITNSSVIITSASFSCFTELIFSYFIELVCVSDYLFTVYPYKTPVLPSENFCKNWVDFCESLVSKSSDSSFIKKKFENIYWSRSQFYGEVEKSDSSRKILQIVPITSIMISNRYGHYETIINVTAKSLPDIFKFCTERITRCISYADQKDLFKPCWDIRKQAQLRGDISSRLISDRFYHGVRKSINKDGEIRNDISIAEMRNSDLITNDIFSPDLVIDKEEDEIRTLIEMITEEMDKVALSSKHPTPFTLTPVISPADTSTHNQMIDKSISNRNNNTLAMSVIERALEKLTSYKHTVLEKEELMGHDALRNDEQHFNNKLKHIPIGLLEYNLTQEAILSLLSVKSASFTDYSSNVTVALLNKANNLTNVSQIMHQASDTEGLEFSIYDTKGFVTEDGSSICDKIVDHCFNPQNSYIPKLSLKNSNILDNDDYMDYPGDDSDEMDSRINQRKGLDDDYDHEYNSLRSSVHRARKRLEESYSNNENTEDGEPFWNRSNSDDGVCGIKFNTSKLPISYIESFVEGSHKKGLDNNGNHSSESSDEDQHEDENERNSHLTLEDEEFGPHENINRQKRDKVNLRNKRFKMGQGKSLLGNEEAPKEWPEIMNYDLLEVRSTREKEGLEYPLTIFECIKLKTHELFKRSTSDRPCIFTFFNKYHICGYNYLTTYGYVFSDEINEDDLLGELQDQYECPLPGPYDFAIIIGTLIHTFESSVDVIIEKFYENKDKLQKKDADIFVSTIQAYYRTFPEIILKNTLEYEREFNITESVPIVKKFYV